MTLIEALKKLDPSNDNHWTAEGIPRLETVRILTGDQSVNREKIDTYAPGFNRTNAATYEAPNLPQETQTQEGTPPKTEISQGEASQSSEDSEIVNDSEKEVKIVYTVEMLEEAQRYLDGLRLEIEKLQAKYAEGQVIVDKMITELHDEGLKESFSDVMQGYLKSQQAIREEQAAKLKAIRDAGFNPKEFLKQLVPQSAPIDAAMARSTNPNSGRPKLI